MSHLESVLRLQRLAGTANLVSHQFVYRSNASDAVEDVTIRLSNDRFIIRAASLTVAETESSPAGLLQAHVRVYDFLSAQRAV